MMKWLYKLEYKHPNWCIPNLMMVIIAGKALVYVAEMFSYNFSLIEKLSLNFNMVLRGEVWRLVTFLFVPDTTTPIALLITLYFYYFIGHGLELAWGDFKFNVYYLFGTVGAIAAAVLMWAVFGIGYATSSYLNLSLFFAYAMLWPNTQLLLFFIIPVKIKYLAWFSAAVCLFNFIFGGWMSRFSIALSLVNFLIFFGGDFFRRAKQEITYFKARRTWKRNNTNWR